MKHTTDTDTNTGDADVDDGDTDVIRIGHEEKAWLNELKRALLHDEHASYRQVLIQLRHAVGIPNGGDR